jgi:phospholipase C
MRLKIKLPSLCIILAAVTAQAQISQFRHIIIVFQENRTPDNLFHALCTSNTCSTNPNNTEYNIQTSNWLDRSSPTGFTQPTRMPLNNGYDLDHSHSGWLKQCNPAGTATLCKPAGFFPLTSCQMNGASCTSPKHGAYIFVDNSTGILNPYLTLATSYGWANYMFQTNEGPSFPAHQFIFGGSSALSADGDASGFFISANFGGAAAGCYAQDGEITRLVGPNSKETTYTIDHATGKTVCIPPQSRGGRNTMADLLDGANLTWTYYSSAGAGQDKGGSIWTAPNALQAICVPDANFQNCTGTEWEKHVVIHPSQVLSDLGANDGACDLKNVSWVIPTGANSDHPGSSTGGPAWVASVVNALGESRCTDTINGQSFTYWQDTAVVITWDDWGGFYDHERPTILTTPEGGYQLGFRVPMIFVSAYTPVKYINNARHDFGSILRFIEHNFSLGEGALGFADKRATNDLTGFYNLRKSPRKFISIPISKTVTDFINDKTPPEDVDDE